MTGKTVLVIDTDTETTQQIVSILEAEDYLVFTAPNKDIGLAMAKKVNPSLIFINPSLSGTSGLEVCKTIHGTEQLKDIPIVVLSSFEGATDQRYAEAYGIVDSLKKPFTTKELISKTGNVLSMEHGDIQTSVFQDFPSGEAEETIGFGAAEETVVMKQQMQERQTMPAEEFDAFDASEKTMVRMEKETPEPFEKTVVEDIPYIEPEEILKGETERAYRFKTSIRRRGMRSRLFVPLIVALVIIVIIGTGVGLILYKENLLPWLKSSTSVPVKPAPAEKAAAAPKEPQKPTGETPSSKPAPSPAAKPPAMPSVSSEQLGAAPKTAPKPEPKSTGKIIYHVQLGAFKNTNNAEALAKDYKAKGYETFIQKNAGKDKETLYRVLIGKFENKKEAVKLAHSIEAKEKAKAIIFKE